MKFTSGKTVVIILILFIISSPLFSVDFDIFSQKIIPGIRTILKYDGITLDIPSGALDKAVTIRILKLQNSHEISGSLNNVTTGAAAYRFEPSGLKFNKNIKVSIPFNKAFLESETAFTNLFTYFYNEESKIWERLPRVEIDKEKGVVVSLTNHFTDMINATLKMPESPGSVNFNINSIKNLEAANPSDRVMSLKGLTPDSTGRAFFQIPLNLPPGRGSAYPNLALSYNSESSNSWMGRGFDITVPSITTDTRFGLPKYDDTDTYILGGEELVLIAGSAGFPKRYSPRVEKAFQRIIRKQEGGVDYWEVTDKNGRIQIFGSEEGWIGPDRTNHSKIYTWYLTKETDANGNFVSYIYDYDSVNKYTYLQEVHYSGNNNISTTDKGPYKVVFNTSGSRPDRRIDARGSFVSKLIRRLDEVQISYNGEVFRTYAFGYEQNEFGQTVLNSFAGLDGSGNEFYVYGFDYNKLSARDAGAGVIAYDGFGEEAIEWGAVTGSTFPGLNQTRTFGIGASLYLGVKFELLKYVSFLKWRWRTIAELGVRGGVNFSGTITKSTLLDINGDGLSDAVWRDGGTLKAYPNTGFGFDTGNGLTLPGLPGLLNRSNQKGFSLGVTAGLLGVSGSITMQRNWMNGLSVFNDINGDGFVDFLKAGNDKYYMNTVNKFTPVSFTNSLVEVSQSENINEDDYLRTYFSQEPLRKWKAYTGGSIEVTQSVNLIDSNMVSEDGVKAVTYPEDGYPVTSIDLSSGQPTGSGSRTFIIEDGDEIFFHMDALEDSRGDNIQWDINISYTDINYFEKLNESAIIFPEEHYLYSLPDNRLVDFYNSEYVRYQTDPSRYRWEYTLKPNWEDYFNTSSGDAIIENGFFVPARIPEEIFVTIFSSASDTETILDIFGEPEDLIPGGKAALIDAYNYRAEFKDFIRRNSGADETVREILALQELSLVQLQELFYYNDFEGSNIYPDEAGGVKSYSKVAPLISIIPMIHAEEESVNPGSEFLNGEILLDKIYNDTGTVVETLFLVPNSGSLGLQSRGDQGTFMIPGALISETGSGINISFFRNGIEHSYTLSLPDSVLTSIPASLFDNEVPGTVTADYIFTYPDYNTLDPSEYSILIGLLSQEDKQFFEDVYIRYPAVPDVESYNIKGDVSAEELEQLNTIFPGDDLPDDYASLTPVEYNTIYEGASADDKFFLVEVYNRYPVTPDIISYDLISDLSAEQHTRLFLILDNLSDDNDSILDKPVPAANPEHVGIIALSESEYELYIAGSSDAEGLFNQLLSIDDEVFYLLKESLSDEEKLVIEDIERRYIRDEIEFPYYNYNETDGLYSIKEGLNAEDENNISNILSGLGISVYTSLTRGLKYFSNTRLPVSYNIINTIGNVDNLVPEGNIVLEHTNPGTVTIPYFDNQGRSSYVDRYIHQYNTELDYSMENLISYPETIFNDDTLPGTDFINDTEEDKIPDKFEVFSGGVGGWFYGSWTGYYDFNKDHLHSIPPVVVEGEVILPKYFVSMKPNVKIDGSSGPEVSEIGKKQIFTLNDQTLIGDVSSYTNSDFDDNGNPVNITYDFTSAIDRNTLHADRNGGDTFFNIPRGSTSISGGRIGNISEGKSESMDVNGGIDTGLVSFSFSKNEGKSWQYQGLMDINGDRYPDIISYTSDKSGSGSFSVVEGNGQGFSNEQTYTSPINHLSYNNNVTYGFGASPGSGSGAISQAISAYGAIKATNIGTPDESSDGGLGFAGLNGTAGSSCSTQSFIDVTGDGLPDHIKRDGAGDYLVAVNKGDNSFASLVSYSNGIDESLYSISGNTGDLGNQALGLNFSNSGSLGTGASLTIPGTGIIQGAGLSIGFNASANRTLSRLMDINGDGLNDQVVKKPDEAFFRVRFNLGDIFSNDEIRLYRPEWNTSFADTKGLLQTILGENASVFDDMDIPLVGSIPGVTALPSETSNPFLSIINPLGVDDAISYTGGISINLGASMSLFYGLDFKIARLGFSLVPGINGSYAVSTTSLSMQDITGDGLPDHVLKKTGSDTLLIKINNMGKVGLLNEIILPTGGSIDLEYGRRGNTVAMPQNRYVLTKVTKNDGYEDTPAMTGEHSYTETYDYRDGYYDRGERKFFGFHEVSVVKEDGSVTTTIYNNDNYYTKGLASSTGIEDENGITFLEQNNSYSLRSIGTYTDGEVKYPYLSTELSRTYDVLDSDFIQTEKQYFYDSFGNVIRMEDTGIYSDPDDDIILNIVYSDAHDSNYLINLPTRLTVIDSSNEIIRKREGAYDGNGNLNSLKNYYNEYDYSEYTFEYDNEYGNLISVEDPLGYKKEYTYDNEVHSYVTNIETSSIHGGDSYTSTLSYDYKFGAELSQTDSNGNTLSKEYDNFGRLKTIISPYDTGTVKAVEYNYLTDSFPWMVLTKNKISFNPADTETMDTYVIIDGLNRISITAKEGEVYNEEGNLYGWNKSGYVVYDSKGRPVEEGQTIFEETSSAPTTENTALRPTLKTYDILDRILTITFPDNSVITKSYTIEGNRIKEAVTDPLGNITETYKDIRGNIVGIEKKNAEGTVLTESAYNYNELGELLKVIDAQGNDVTFTYDILGRRLTLQSPETGLTEFEYDKADHLICKVDANLRNNGAAINYIYDSLGRIEKIDYPFMADTSCTYGSQGDNYNRAGRIVRITDESGSTENFYGELGETTQVTKTIKRLTPLEYDKSASFSYTFDYQGRMENITYPDGEAVSYSYNRGGEAESISSSHNSLNTAYIENIGYNEYGQRAYIKYGNGIETKYSYDENRRWLNNIETKNSFTTLQDIDYTFDKTGNILSIINISGKYTTNQNYEYDGLYQLTGGEGAFEDREFGFVSGTSNYTQNFSYDNTGNILSKTSSNLVNTSGGVSALNYDYSYTYYADKPKQAEIIGNLWYLYDSNGNTIEERAGGHSAEGLQSSGTITKNGNITEMNRGIALTRNSEPEDTTYKRSYIWDEENRLKTTVDPAQTVEYCYDSAGERTNKMSGNGGETLYFNSMWLATEDSYNFRMSKNIYLGETRIATRLNMESDPSTGYEAVNTYYYHPDHLGSSNIVTTPDGEVFEHIEYTPYGETWIDKSDDLFDMLPYRFTGKEEDSETGLYYYGARYLNPRTSRWISSDPAGFDLIDPKRYGFNIIESNNWYSYAANNPVLYKDPTGMEIIKTLGLDLMTNYSNKMKLGNSKTELVNRVGCYVAGLGNAYGTRSARSYSGALSSAPDFKATEKLNNNTKLFGANSGNMAGRKTSMDKIFGEGNWDYWTKKVQGVEGLKEKLQEYDDSDKKLMVVGIFDLSDANPDIPNHMVGINGMPGEDGVFASGNIIPTSKGDIDRLRDENLSKVYNMSNLKEFRIIEVPE